MKKLISIKRKSLIYFISTLVVIGLFSNCKKDGDTEIKAPTITEIDEATAFVGTTVTIYGTNFRTSIADNTVSFNGTAAIVEEATAMSLTTTVPTGATTGDVTVTTNGLTSVGFPFTVAIPIIPTITSIDPISGNIGETVTITGTDFSTTPEDNIVSFNGIQAEVTASTATSITTTIPAGASTGNVTVTRDFASNGFMFTITTPVFTIEVSINAELDDIEENIENGQVNDIGSSDLEFGEFDTSGTPDNGLQVIGLRFNGINIPVGATIQTANIGFMSESDGSLECQMTIHGENVGNSLAFDETVLYTVAGRTKTTANAVWDIPAWLQDDITDAQKTVDIAGIIQEIVDRGDWVSGNSLTIIMTPTGSSSAATENDQGREAASFDGDYPPKLTIIYSE